MVGGGFSPIGVRFGISSSGISAAMSGTCDSGRVADCGESGWRARRCSFCDRVRTARRILSQKMPVVNTTKMLHYRGGSSQQANVDKQFKVTESVGIMFGSGRTRRFVAVVIDSRRWRGVGGCRSSATSCLLWQLWHLARYLFRKLDVLTPTRYLC